MVTSDQPTPRINASDILRAVRNGPPKCAVCDAEILGAKAGMGKDSDLRWCEPCNSFQKVYRGPPRRPLCITCFNCTGPEYDYKNTDRYHCAAMKYKMPDGTWRDRYNQEVTTTYREGGVYKDVKPIVPTLMKTPQYVCECYEFLGEGETRESIEKNDPLRFYDKSRFWD